MKRNPVAWAALLVATAALFSSRGFIHPVPAAPETPLEGQKAAQALSIAFENVADYVRPSVVQIAVKKRAGLGGIAPGRGQGMPRNVDPKQMEEMLKRFFPDFKMEKQQFGPEAEGTGSGFFYNNQGHILTNNHVVEGADQIEVTFHDGEKAAAKIVGTDPEADVAVIRVDRTDYRSLPTGKSRALRVGELVMAVGSPFGLSQTVTTGIVSATERTPQINAFEDFIQTDAAINPGNSGGPLVDMAGKVVGINSAIATAGRGMGGSGANAGVGFAIPIDMAARIADKLIKDGKISRARVGIAMEDLTPTKAKQAGLENRPKAVRIEDVNPNSPAEKAGLKAGDIVLSFDGEPVYSISGFRNHVSTSDVGKSYEMKYLRNGKEHTAQIVPAPQDEVVFAVERQRRAPSRPVAAERAAVPDYGFVVQPVTKQLARQFGYAEDIQGLIVASVDEDGHAGRAGLEAGDLITQVIRDKKPQPITSPAELVEAAKVGDEIAIFVQDVKHQLPGQFLTITKSDDGK